MLSDADTQNMSFTDVVSVKHRHIFIIFVLCVLLATFLRIYRLEKESLWFDEISQVLVAQDGLPKVIIGTASHHGSSPLDYLITHFELEIGQSSGVLIGCSNFLFRIEAFWFFNGNNIGIVINYFTYSYFLF